MHSTLQKLLTNWTSYEDTLQKVETSIALLNHQAKMIGEETNDLESKQARIHEQKALCHTVGELQPRYVNLCLPAVRFHRTLN